MRDVQLPAYRAAGFRTVAIASRTPANARAAAEQNGIDRVYDSWPELLADPEVEIVDIAYPPDGQLEIVRAACAAPHVRGHPRAEADRGDARRRAGDRARCAASPARSWQ